MVDLFSVIVALCALTVSTSARCQEGLNATAGETSDFAPVSASVALVVGNAPIDLAIWLSYKAAPDVSIAQPPVLVHTCPFISNITVAQDSFFWIYTVSLRARSIDVGSAGVYHLDLMGREYETVLSTHTC